MVRGKSKMVSVTINMLMFMLEAINSLWFANNLHYVQVPWESNQNPFDLGARLEVVRIDQNPYGSLRGGINLHIQAKSRWIPLQIIIWWTCEHVFVFFKFCRLSSFTGFLGILRNPPESPRNPPGISSESPRNSMEFFGIPRGSPELIWSCFSRLCWFQSFWVESDISTLISELSKLFRIIWVILLTIGCFSVDLLVSVLFRYKPCGFWTQTDKHHVLNSVPSASANHCRF